jgi:hypothetical protein
MSDHDELLARADEAIHRPRFYPELIADLAAALRAALATQPQPLFEGRIVDATASARFTIQADSAGVTYPGPNDRVVVYPVAAGSATPDGDDHG